MKSWRTITAAALVASAPATALFAGGKCEPSLNLTPIFPLVMCVERDASTSNNLGNGFPWENDTTFFANYRNQFLYPSSTVSAVAARAVTIESMHSRAVSFSGAATNVYGSAATDNKVTVGRTAVGSLSKTFSANLTSGPEFLNWVGPKTIGMSAASAFGGGSTQLSDFVSRGTNPATRNNLDKAIDFRVVNPSTTNLIVDTLMRVTAAGNSGNGIWDVTSGACSAPKRAYGSGTFVNSAAVTTAFGIDTMAFVWVFRGLGLPPPSTVQQQIAEIIRLLITPEGLRCAGLDLTINGKLNDDALNFPGGKDWDAISPQITNGNPLTGEEGDNSPRKHGWQ